jgi:hypothetical protein
MTQKDMLGKATKTVSMWFFVIITALIFLFVGLYDFVSYSFNWQSLLDPAYWAMFFITIALSISVFFLSVGQSKKKHLLDIDWLINEIAMLADIIQVALDQLFGKVVDKINKEDKLKIYEYRLNRKKDWIESLHLPRTWKDKKINAIKEELNRIRTDTDINIEHKKIRGFKPISTNEIYSGYSSRSQLETQNLHYSGYENLATWIIPVIIIATLILGIALGSDFGTKAVIINMIIQTLIKLIIMLLYVWQGTDYGNYSINTVYKSVLGRRKGLMSNFLLDNKYSINPAQKSITQGENGSQIVTYTEMEITLTKAGDENV